MADKLIFQIQSITADTPFDHFNYMFLYKKIDGWYETSGFTIIPFTKIDEDGVILERGNEDWMKSEYGAYLVEQTPPLRFADLGKWTSIMSGSTYWDHYVYYYGYDGLMKFYGDDTLYGIIYILRELIVSWTRLVELS